MNLDHLDNIRRLLNPERARPETARGLLGTRVVVDGRAAVVHSPHPLDPAEAARLARLARGGAR